MKKLISIFVLAILQLGLLPFVFAQEKKTGYEVFFINRQDNQEEYQLYKGVTIAFYEPTTPSERLFNLSGVEFGVPYTIQKIQSYYALGIPHVDFLITKEGDEGGKGIHIKCRNSESTEKKPGILDIPAYLYLQVEALKDKYLKKQVSVNGKQYTIADLHFGSREVSFVFLAEDGDSFKEPVLTALDFTVSNSLSVEKPENEAILYGKTSTITVNDIIQGSYEDNVLGIVIYSTSLRFDFSIINLSDNTLRIIWDEAAIVDIYGNTSKIIHSGIKYSEMEKAQIPSIIVKGAKINDIAIPIDNIEYDERLGWRTVRKIYEPEQDGNIALLLPIQIKGVTNEYLFVFNRTLVLRHPELHDTVKE